MTLRDMPPPLHLCHKHRYTAVTQLALRLWTWENQAVRELTGVGQTITSTGIAPIIPCPVRPVRLSQPDPTEPFRLNRTVI